MRRLERSRQEHYAPRVPGDALEGGNDGAGRGGPHQEDRIDAVETSLQRVGKSQVSAHDLGPRRECHRVGFARQGADRRARARQLGEDLPTDIARRSDDEDTIHSADHGSYRPTAKRTALLIA